MTLVLVSLLSMAHPPPVQVGCACAVITPTPGGWCQQCAVGFVAGRKITCPQLVEAIDTHGHPVSRAGLDCPQCRVAFDARALCTTCNWGFVGDRLFFTPLTWALARGTYSDPTKVTCAECRSMLSSGGWCAPCARGRVGDFTWRERSIYDIARRDYARLLDAANTCKRCPQCATAQFFGSSCPRCKKSFKRAQPPSDGPADRRTGSSGDQAAPRHDEGTDRNQ